ncbi:hypothetical protein NC796_23950 [Aliifodinibius sp. S!AR15-10]|uniref:hypothetical protein n=1 Tax=Aliifodinibius sp. S!AR15-10 TaxID=2950437 RepID=UPI00285ECF8B|nr:hypothetical protein [Aliifodinibius sp. S!AR15-10]MDR8394223.1 hypothetical protein [Aliifodinibius sp. S!AR15-10]
MPDRGFLFTKTLHPADPQILNILVPVVAHFAERPFVPYSWETVARSAMSFGFASATTSQRK